ncbi:MAG: ribosomal-processing cysteine protease Prp [Lachnospiraceae bacterium]
MITVTISKNGSGNYTGFTCIGHAGFADSGKDIVCAAVSMLVINTINSLDQLLKEPFHCASKESTGEITVRFETAPSMQAVLLLDSMVLGLTEVKKQYGKKYILLKFEEV